MSSRTHKAIFGTSSILYRHVFSHRLTKQPFMILIDYILSPSRWGLFFPSGPPLERSDKRYHFLCSFSFLSQVERMVRQHGAVPATIAVIAGLDISSYLKSGLACCAQCSSTWTQIPVKQSTPGVAGYQFQHWGGFSGNFCSSSLSDSAANAGI